MRRALLLIIILSLLSGAFVGWQHTLARRGKLSPPERVSFNVLRVVQQPLLATGRWVSDVGRVIFYRENILRENRDLHNRVSYLKNENTRLRRYSRENIELRKLLQLPKPVAGKEMAADVVNFDATDLARQVGISIGSSNGLQRKDVVYAAAGVVGQITRVAPHYSIVTLLTDRQSGVGAATARSGARGVLTGTGGSLCKMSYFDFHSDVRRGDVVITSGDSEIFPRGMVLGSIIKVEKDPAYSRLTAWVEPAVDFGSLTSVLVRVGANK